MHHNHNSKLLPSLSALFRAFDNVDPPEHRQKASTPKFLRHLFRFGQTKLIRPNIYDHAVDIIIGNFFFASRSCEYAIPPRPGKTQTLCLHHIKFRDKHKRLLSITDPHLEDQAIYVSVTFEDQKSKKRTSDPVLCPCRRFSQAIRRIVTTFPEWS
eukprot:CAMPEP_0178937828 /NCGR_PEP_ID=MMETSP0786-20121207/25985_1 /TAXON_ID=186022 /ORGANISM="Thalassionema frauenfeldii, Strain CCMP 1798" /LENGTH=155 /DNA_ID=CAMNT_0020616465 /DNA_START=105 /DNA_END=569 /DNA_ORIENTATION=+